LNNKSHDKNKCWKRNIFKWALDGVNISIKSENIEMNGRMKSREFPRNGVFCRIEVKLAVDMIQKGWLQQASMRSTPSSKSLHSIEAEKAGRVPQSEWQEQRKGNSNEGIEQHKVLGNGRSGVKYINNSRHDMNLHKTHNSICKDFHSRFLFRAVFNFIWFLNRDS
jgi:hypothetical protein